MEKKRISKIFKSLSQPTWTLSCALVAQNFGASFSSFRGHTRGFRKAGTASIPVPAASVQCLANRLVALQQRQGQRALPLAAGSNAILPAASPRACGQACWCPAHACWQVTPDIELARCRSPSRCTAPSLTCTQTGWPPARPWAMTLRH